MKHTIKPASGLLVAAVLMTVALSACLPLPSTTQPAPQETAAPQAVETIAPQPAETATPAPTETAAPEAAATSEATTTSAVMLERTSWGLVSYAGKDGNQADVLPGSEVTAQFMDGNVNGNGGCNNYFARYDLNGAQLTVGPIGSTMMACAEAVMAQEAAYFADLAASATYAINGDQLEIAGADGKTLLTYKVLQPTPLVGTDWQLIMYNNGKEAVVSTLAGTQITAMFGEDGSLSGSAGCNNYTATYAVDGNSLKVTAPAATQMMCDEPAGVMDQEAAYLQALQMAATYSITGNELEIADGDGNTLLIYTAITATPLTGVTWSLTTYNNGKDALVSVLNGTEITATFGEDGNLSGSAGCNNYTATYATEGNQISIGPMANTLMACADPEGIMEQETAYLAALEKATTFRTEGQTLELSDANGTKMAIYAAQAQPAGEGTSQAGTTPAIIGAPWEWVGSIYNNDTKAVPANPENYQMELVPDGTITVKADCNTASGTYTLQDNQISIDVTASTMMACPAESLGDQFIKDLNAAQSFMMDGEDLIIVLKLDTGSMRLQAPAAPSASPSAVPEAPEVAVTPEAQATAGAAGGTADLLGVVWMWESTTSSAGQQMTVDNPDRYEFMLLPTGTIRVKADCNNGSGAFWTEGSSISIEVLTLTRAACPPGSLSDQFVQMLNQASSYRIEAGDLYLELGDGSTMKLSTAE